MSEYERLGIGPVTADRILEQADLFLRELAERPDETLCRRRAAKFLGDMTRHYMRVGQLPQEALARFWSYLEVAPAYRGQAEALGILDHGPREPLVRAMAEGAESLRVRARHWVDGLDRRTAAPRHLLLVTLPFSGASAVVPILQDYLREDGFVLSDDLWKLEATFAAAEAEGRRVFVWGHAHPEDLEPWLRRPDVAVAYLHRDLRDVTVSSMTDVTDAPNLFMSIVGYRLDELWPEGSPYWQELARTAPAAHVLTFDAMKADVAGCARGLFRLVGLSPDEERLRRLAEAYSFTAVAGHREGEGDSFRRFGQFVVRKGTSGQWRERFDRTCALFFAAKYGHLLLASGWAADMDWIDEVQG